MASSKARSGADRELDAIGAILHALQGLEGESIQRVLDYVFDRLSIASSVRARPSSSPSPAVSPIATSATTFDSAGRRPSIRDLKEQKEPESANQMAALVAYYLSEEAGPEDQKESVGTADLEKYFKQAGFRLPRSLPQTLPNAAAAGYFDPIGNGLYKLNPVGYNLVVHGLPRSHKPTERRPSRSRKKKAATQRRNSK